MNVFKRMAVIAVMFSPVMPTINSADAQTVEFCCTWRQDTGKCDVPSLTGCSAGCPVT